MYLFPSLEVNKESAYIKVVAKVDRFCLQIINQELFFSKALLCKMPDSFNFDFFLQVPVMGIGIILFHRKV